jgi:hypothetical protein
MPIKRGPLAQQGRIPRQEPPHDDDIRLRFSFRHFYITQKFSPDRCPNGYIHKFLERFRDLSHLTVKEFRTNRNATFHIKRIYWEASSEQMGFANLNEQFRSEEAWEFEITRNEHGRVHGLLMEDTFYIIWIDPEHLLFL